MRNLVCYFITAVIVFILATSAIAAPLFPDVPENHWARDAVADLAAKGIIEGYPDGTFKGDRAATRWEMAMALQRFLAKMEAEHAKFATKSDLEALRALVNNLKDELDALGVRVKNLEENVSALDKRVTELERITFKGDFVTRFVTVGMQNTGRTAYNWNTDVGSINSLLPNAISGNKTGVVDLFTGLPLINGSGFTARARLGVKVKINKEARAGIRFAAFTSLGDRYIDAYWGVSAPYLSNPFTGNSYGSAQNINNNIWTRMTLDQFWIEHIPSKSTIIVGLIENTQMDDFMLRPIPNPGYDGRNISHLSHLDLGCKKEKPEIDYWSWRETDNSLPFYGIQLNGKMSLMKNWSGEIMYAKLPDSPQQSNLWGADANDLTVPYLFSLSSAWAIGRQGLIRVNFMRVSENFNNGQSTNNIANRGNFWQWTDPWDRRNDAINKRPMRSSANVAPYISQQGQTSYGISIRYCFMPSNIKVAADYGGSQYKPNLESGYNVNGNHFRIGVG